MNILLPLCAAVLQAASFTLDKAILSLKRVGFISYTGASFPLVFIITGVIFFIVRPELSVGMFGSGRWALIVLSVVGSAISNLLYYRALKNDALQEIQALDLLQAIPVILVSSIFFSDERNPYLVFPALAAALAVVWSHWDHHRIRIAKKTLPYVLWSLAIAPLSAPISRALLLVWSPVSLELVRAAGMALIFLPFTLRSYRTLSFTAWRLIIVTNMLTAVAWILFYASYQRSGIVYTVLLFSLQPILVYFASLFILKERAHRKKIAAFGIILISIIFAQIMA
ncbi:MAG: hypothetical protein A3I44_04175 [Candidatus Sungbacteria bacterium RIFCSPLOWO2_02_FULL_51_17]|uniref:EamA domain-containing protein n=1 Tax=Candidatus Sungbacteria bacterium RIFCSPHIGHO2_02_FULL_51_29 TaxID=1802273 RepID=A0A1G2KWY1_9BACT|nr:MAG: hypothetical protein A2676_02690 [Candidatus Sungbacteria bacterium RIFCSPHIGHO2_01_FULL_51_22]OHA03704.1 MAG: hypothetical protein A3C16_03655 [Candidatus Sungbacteria bacterium RIFCSPHIGHO2_02_FULL_51_29]OHA07312.1 MAG: hypothetical protein A3B29_02780 [Candidatus Sungbacteria bacterium RIFCSPLOWO2_01_FULL_51_34]OHA11275.1 MAG: hypothetical protein A3I44_04175 [Candidatus Sungbacteria bacterium RIFCSPLOWO2_02_FULL_51_17]